MNYKKVLMFVIMLFVASDIAFAAIFAAPNVGGLFGKYFYVINVGLFGAAFVALCRFGFGAALKDKNSNKLEKESNGIVWALSISVGAMFALALVYGANFTILSLVPYVSLLSLFGLMIVLFVVLKNYIFKSDSASGKIVTAIMSIVLAVILVFLITTFICGSACENSPLLRKIAGSESVLGRATNWLNENTGTEVTSERSSSSKNNVFPIRKSAENSRENSGSNLLSWTIVIIGILIAIFSVYRVVKKNKKKEDPFAESLRKMRKVSELFKKICEDAREEKHQVESISKIVTDEIVKQNIKVIGTAMKHCEMIENQHHLFKMLDDLSSANERQKNQVKRIIEFTREAESLVREGIKEDTDELKRELEILRENINEFINLGRLCESISTYANCIHELLDKIIVGPKGVKPQDEFRWLENCMKGLPIQAEKLYNYYFQKFQLIAVLAQNVSKENESMNQLTEHVVMTIERNFSSLKSSNDHSVEWFNNVGDNLIAAKDMCESSPSINERLHGLRAESVQLLDGELPALTKRMAEDFLEMIEKIEPNPGVGPEIMQNRYFAKTLENFKLVEDKVAFGPELSNKVEKHNFEVNKLIENRSDRDKFKEILEGLKNG